MTPDTVPENSMSGTEVGCITGEDDATQILTFTLVDTDNKLFEMYDKDGKSCIRVSDILISVVT